MSVKVFAGAHYVIDNSETRFKLQLKLSGDTNIHLINGHDKKAFSTDKTNGNEMNVFFRDSLSDTVAFSAVSHPDNFEPQMVNLRNVREGKFKRKPGKDGLWKSSLEYKVQHIVGASGEDYYTIKFVHKDIDLEKISHTATKEAKKVVKKIEKEFNKVEQKVRKFFKKRF